MRCVHVCMGVNVRINVRVESCVPFIFSRKALQNFISFSSKAESLFAFQRDWNFDTANFCPETEFFFFLFVFFLFFLLPFISPFANQTHFSIKEKSVLRAGRDFFFFLNWLIKSGFYSYYLYPIIVITFA